MKVYIALFRVDSPGGFSTSRVFSESSIRRLLQELGSEDNKKTLKAWLKSGSRGYCTLKDFSGRDSTLVFLEEVQ